MQIDVYQIGTARTSDENPFGLLYAGQIQVPEPGTLMLFGTAMIGLGLTTRGRARPGPSERVRLA